MSKSKKWIALIMLILLPLSWRLTRSPSSTQVNGDSEIPKPKRNETTSPPSESARKIKTTRAPADESHQDNLPTTAPAASAEEEGK